MHSAEYTSYVVNRHPKWLLIRKMCLERAGHKCQFPGCESTKRLHVHHLSYANLNSQNMRLELDDTMCLCEGHHHMLHSQEAANDPQYEMDLPCR